MLASPNTIELAWRTYFVPTLRRAGFKGTGRNFRRLSGDYAVAVGLQSWDGKRFAVNLSIQPLSIPDVMGAAVDPKRVTEMDCEFRRRMSEGASDQWWSYDTSWDSKTTAAIAAARVFENHAHTEFLRLTGSDSPLVQIDPVSFDTGMFNFGGFESTKVRMARSLALMRLAAENPSAARDFAKIALRNIGSASALKAELEDVVATGNA